MRKYEKPSINVIELQLRENIAAIRTTVYKGKKKNGSFDTNNSNPSVIQMALTSDLTGVDEIKNLIS